MTIFRENTEDIYAGIEWAGGSAEAQKVLDFVQKEFPQMFGKIRFGTEEKNATGTRRWKASARRSRELPVQVGIGLKPVSVPGHRAPGAQRHRATRSRTSASR
jgi:isocitrate dehydrogenase